MATTANPPPGATPTHNSSQNDPFVSTPGPIQAAQLRYATLDDDQFNSYSSSSPAQARRALEAHLKETDRRIHDAAKLGNTLLEQKKTLSARLKDVAAVEKTDEVPSGLRQKLAELEKEYNEVGRESARAFLPKLKASSTSDTAQSSMLSGQGGASPSKVSAPSRRQRNQPGNRVHDIEFATEISTSLLAQVRQLQAALAEKDEALKDTASARAQLENDVTGMAQRIKQMDESTENYKDETWNLETKIQELESALRESTDKEQRLGQTLKSTQVDKTTAQRDLDELKLSHDKALEFHAATKKQQDADLHALRRDLTNHDTEKQSLQRKIDELNSNNRELARAVSYRWNQSTENADTNDALDKSEDEHDESFFDQGDISPVKGTPARPGMLESETLKSSLNHAHRMIQNLKNNIHREKTEKLELKRMLSDARDELDKRRNDGPSRTPADKAAKKRAAAERDNKTRRPLRIGPGGVATTDIIEDEPDWEDQDDVQTPSKSRNIDAPVVAGALHEDTESTDAFETADELRESTTETEGFHTGAESFGDDSDELTETEGGVNRNITVRKRVSNLANAAPGDRRSYMSTASTSDEEEDDAQIRTPGQNQGPKYRLRVNRNGRRSGRYSGVFADSPASNNSTPQNAGKSLGDELDALDDDDSFEGTPSRLRDELVDSTTATPETTRFTSAEPSPANPADLTDIHEAEAGHEPRGSQISSPVSLEQSPRPHGEEGILAHQANAAMLAHESTISKPAMVDAGIMTEPWVPQKEIIIQTVPAEAKDIEEKKQQPAKKLGDRIVDAAGGALAGFGLGRIKRDKESTPASSPVSAQKQRSVDDERATDATSAEPVVEQREVSAPDHAPSASLAFQPSSLVDPESKPTELAVPESGLSDTPSRASVIHHAPVTEPAAQSLNYSTIMAQHYEPHAGPAVGGHQTPPTPLLPERSSKRPDVADSIVPLSNDSSEARRGSQSVPASANEDSNLQYIEPKVYGGGRGANGIPTLVLGDDEPDDDVNRGSESRAPLPDFSPNVSHGERDSSIDHVPITKPLQIRKPTLDEGSQTLVSGQDIETMMRDKSRVLTAGAAIGAGAVAGAAGEKLSFTESLRRSIDNAAASADPSRGPRRPASVGSIRNKSTLIAPPLPADHTEKIAAAAKTPTPAAPGSMGPPLMPASAYRLKRPTTPSGAVNPRTMSRDSTTPRPGRASVRDSSASGRISRSTSISSFASELDERFNINRGHLAYPDDVTPPTDPRMIQAITQTMIGEYLWKYTRKAGRSETSSVRHRRFFWVHPYTRTMYWSTQDPSSATKNMMKAKSVPIESVRVISDDNAYPPGLHRKSLVIMTPGREIVVTAPTSQRHETWFNSLSYLLLRTGPEKGQGDATIDEEDVDEFNPRPFSFRQSISRMTRGRSRSRASLSSYNSRTTRNSSPNHHNRESNPMAERQAAASQRVGTATSNPSHASVSSRPDPARESSRFSTIASKIISGGTAARGSVSSANPGRSSMSSHGRDGEIYNASVVGESAEDVRQVIEKQEKDADLLENVRACCDGKHDVGSLSRNSRLSLRSRISGSHTHTLNNHGHTHTPSTAEPIQNSNRPRRGE